MPANEMPSNQDLAEIAYEAACKAIDEIDDQLAQIDCPQGYRPEAKRRLVDRIRDDMRDVIEYHAERAAEIG